MFSITITGDADHSTERRFLEAACALVEQFGQHIDTATATSEFHADVDLVEGLSITLEAPEPAVAESETVAEPSPGGDDSGDGSEPTAVEATPDAPSDEPAPTTEATPAEEPAPAPE